MNKIPAFHELPTSRLVLRRFNETDLSIFLAYRNDPEIARYQSWESTTADQARLLINNQYLVEPGTPGVGFQFAVALGNDGPLIGDCFFAVPYDEPRQGEIGYTFARLAQGQGFATEAVTALLSYAFCTLGLHRVTARAACANLRSVALLERLGMRREGTMQRSFWRAGVWLDEYLYAMLHDEWAGQADREEQRPSLP